MPLLHLVVLAAIQGITEFLPISSSGHLIVGERLLGIAAGGLAAADEQRLVIVAVHVGTLGAVALYLRRDLWDMLRALPSLVRGRMTPAGQLLIQLAIGTVPVVIAGLLLKEYFGGMSLNVTVIAWATLGFGVLLYATDSYFMTVLKIEQMTIGSALFIGLFQAVALIPGTSRSGITMTAARILGYERTDAARFSMLLSIPTIIAAGTLEGIELARSGNVALTLQALIAAGLALVSALVAIVLMMAWLRRATFTPFVIYRVILGLILLAWVYGLFGNGPLTAG